MTAPLGTYFLERDQPPLSSEEAEVVRQFVGDLDQRL